MMTAQETSNPNSFAPETITGLFNDAADQSRAYVERSLRLLQNEALELMNRRIGNTGAIIQDYRHCKDFADLMTAQHKWFADLSRDYFDAWRRMGEATQRLMTDRSEELHGDFDEESAEMNEAMREAGREIERAAREAAE